MKYIGAYYNKKTSRPICYHITDLKVTTNPKEAFEYADGIGLHKFLLVTLNAIYNAKDSGGVIEHERFHIREDYFKGIKKEDVMTMITTTDNEILFMRKLKILKLYEKSRV
jgi:hypothetical protein